MLVFAAAIALGAYAKIVHEPFSKKVAFYQGRMSKARLQLEDLQSKMPALGPRKEKISALRTECDRLVEKMRDVEKKLPSKNDTSKLIGEFTRLAKQAKLLSIRQKVVTKDGYDRLFIEVKLNAAYAAAINYVAQLESITPFLHVEEMDINEAQGKSVEEGGAPVRIVVSTFLGDVAGDRTLKADDAASVQTKRDILVSKAGPTATLSEKDFKLEGITYNEESPTAIINGEVYKINSEIKGLKVKQILPSGVVLTDGVQEHILSLNK